MDKVSTHDKVTAQLEFTKCEYCKSGARATKRINNQFVCEDCAKIIIASNN